MEFTSTDSTLIKQLFSLGNDTTKIGAALSGGKASPAMVKDIYDLIIAEGWTFGGELERNQLDAKKALEDNDGSIANALRDLGDDAPTALTLTNWATKFGWVRKTRSRSRLTTDQWLEIRSRWEAGEDIEAIAADFPIKAGSISVKAYNKADRWDADARRAVRPSSRGRTGMSTEELARITDAYNKEMAKSGNANLALARAMIADKGTRSAQSVLNNVKKAQAEAEAAA